MTWLVVILGLAALVFVHELGHFTVARLVGMKPRAFYVGFPPALVTVRRNGIEYGIGAIPLGGYVRIPGMQQPAGSDFASALTPAVHADPALGPAATAVRRALSAGDFDAAREALSPVRAELQNARLTPPARQAAERAVRDVDEGTGADAYWRQPTWKRVLAIAAGPVTNVLVAFVLFFAVNATGAPSPRPSLEVAQVRAGTPAAAAGLRAGDRIVAVDGHRTRSFEEASTRIVASRGRPITITVERRGHMLTLGPRPTVEDRGRWVWGFAPAPELVSHPLGESASLAIRDCWRVVTGTVASVGNLFRGRQHAEVTGPVGIVRTSAQVLQIGLPFYLELLGLISMSLALFNLLPLLPLDGGNIVIALVEAVRRRPVPRLTYQRLSMIGTVLIVFVTLVSLSNDIGGTHQ
jgi:regulator of sigma E protease